MLRCKFEYNTFNNIVVFLNMLNAEYLIHTNTQRISIYLYLLFIHFGNVRKASYTYIQNELSRAQKNTQDVRS
jgi:hypothetical protein